MVEPRREVGVDGADRAEAVTFVEADRRAAGPRPDEHGTAFAASAEALGEQVGAHARPAPLGIGGHPAELPTGFGRTVRVPTLEPCRHGDGSPVVVDSEVERPRIVVAVPDEFDARCPRAQDASSQIVRVGCCEVDDPGHDATCCQAR